MDIPASEWRLPDDACAILARLVEENQPEVIIEAGSGRSTVVVAAELHALGHGRLISLEHDRKYWEATRAFLRSRGLLTVADVRLAQLEPHGHEGLLAAEWYARSGWDDLDEIGMLIVDGPPGRTGRFARHPAVPLLRSRLLTGCVVVLDDLNRDDEQKTAEAWGIEFTRVRHAKATLGYGTIDA